jgi:hypothetical protein
MSISNEQVEGNRQTLAETARDFGAREAYRNFPKWSDDLEHRIMADWEAVVGQNWLEVREQVKQGWDAMHAIVAPGTPYLH